MDPGTLLVAEQAISTTVEGAALASIGLAQQTQPLSATFTRIANGTLLARSFHTLSIVSEHAYILGGKTDKGDLAGNEIHIITLPSKSRDEGEADYKCVPALGEQGAEAEVPAARAGHSASAIGAKIYVFGGYGETGSPLSDEGRIWVFDTKSLRWSHIDPKSSDSFPKPRFHHGFAASEHPLPSGYDGKLRLLGTQIQDTVSRTIPKLVNKPSPPAEPHGLLFISSGLSSATSEPFHDAWAFSIASQTWIELPTLPPNLAHLPSLTLASDHLYLAHGISDVDSEIHYLPIGHILHPKESSEPETENPHKALSWQTLPFPTNPLIPGPRPRIGAGFLLITIGNGRSYLLYFLGEKPTSPNPISSPNKDALPAFWSDVFSFQPPATSFTPASAKDATREAVGVSSGERTWAEVKVIANEEATGLTQAEGKSHPGPRAWFGYDVIRGGEILLWGGIDGRGDTQGDGWVVSVG